MPHRWNNAAQVRKQQIENGLDITFSYIFVPLYINVIKETSPMSIVEIGAGTGHLARELVNYCNNYFAIEPSKGMFETAREVLKNKNVELLNCKIEDFDYEKTFDLVFSHLCAHAMEDIDNLYKKMHTLLSLDGKWLFSIPHPCFYNEYKKMIPDNYCYMEERKVDFDLTITKDKRVIEKVPYYHRPLHVYINKMVENGLVIEKMEEVFPTEDIQKMYGDMWTTPRYIIFSGRKI